MSIHIYICVNIYINMYIYTIWPKTGLFRGVCWMTRFSTFSTKTHFPEKPKKLTKSRVRIGEVSLVQNSTKHPQRASEVSEENSNNFFLLKV